jgi:M6 family metalloprotease-like protein
VASGKKLVANGWKFLFILLVGSLSVKAAEYLDIRVLRVEFLYEEKDNSLTTGRGTFCSDTKDYKLDPCGQANSRSGAAYWENHLEFAKNYFKRASGGKVSMDYKIYPEDKNAYKLDKYIIDYNRTSRKKGEKMAEFDSARAVDYAKFVDDVLRLAKEDAKKPLESSGLGKRVILIAHAGSSRLVDGGTMGTRGANTPGDFMDAYIDTTWGDFWRGFEVLEGDTITSVMVTSETASQDGLNWGINGTIISQIGRELGLPYSYDVVKGYSRLGYFDGMDFVGSNAGNGFFPSLPSAWMRGIHKDWASVKTISPGKNERVDICAAGYDKCGEDLQIVKIPINSNEYILLENRQKTYSPNGKISVEMDNGQIADIFVDSLQKYFLDSASQKSGVIKDIMEPDAALPASGIAAWHVNDWYTKELLPIGAINAWNGDTFKDHQFGIALIGADNVLGLGKEFKNAAGESVFYFGSGTDLIPHKKFGGKKQFDTTFSINPFGYANTASTFGGYSGIKITAEIPPNAKPEKNLNTLTGDSVVNWRALKIPVKIEWIGEFARPISIDEYPYKPPTDEDFAKSKWADFMRINIEGGGDSIYLGNNRLYITDSNSVPLPNFPVVLSNGEPFENFHSKPIALDLTGCDSLYVLIPANNGLILAANSKGKLLKGEFPLAAGAFEYSKPDSKPDTLLLHISDDYKYLFAKHRNSISAFYLPKAKQYVPKLLASAQKDEITEFFIFPNPVKNGKASMRFRIQAPASSASLDIFDITGFKVFSKSISTVNHGSNQIEGLDFSKLGSDIYSARLTVKFESGQKKEKWFRMGAIR